MTGLMKRFFLSAICLLLFSAIVVLGVVLPHGAPAGPPSPGTPPADESPAMVLSRAESLREQGDLMGVPLVSFPAAGLSFFP